MTRYANDETHFTSHSAGNNDTFVKEFSSTMSQDWHTYTVNRTRLPHQRGTKKCINRYGERLVCVRYRDDAEGQRKITTVEIVAEERPWHPVSKPIPDDAYVS